MAHPWNEDNAEFIGHCTDKINLIMKKSFIFLLLISFGLFSCDMKRRNSSDTDIGKIKIEWTDSLKGDYSFQNRWSYKEGIYLNEYGQLSCDGLCPEGTEIKKESNGKIFADSLTAFYQLIDTTHQFHTIQSEAWCYEWDGTNYIIARQTGLDSVDCYTLLNSSTHCSLHFVLTNGFCYPSIELRSIIPTGNKIYECTGGYILIDRERWKQRILKSEFNFTFYHAENIVQPMYWKGKIVTKIE